MPRSSSRSASKPESTKQTTDNPFLVGILLLACLVIATMLRDQALLLPTSQGNGKIAPLAMQGGDPYIRALMRTISASEANDASPYTILYGGQHVSNLNSHPDVCITIVSGPNTGDCTTAAGRYQLLTTTWLEEAQRYHPRRSYQFFWQSYSFEPTFQDAVVYAWLNDPAAWGADLQQLLRDGHLDRVLRLLSPTWTSLGYGIESNSMSDDLPKIYQQMLAEELRR